MGKWSIDRPKNNNEMMSDLGMSEEDIGAVVDKLNDNDSMFSSIRRDKIFLYYNEKSEKEKRRFREDILRGEHRYTLKSLFRLVSGTELRKKLDEVAASDDIGEKDSTYHQMH